MIFSDRWIAPISVLLILLVGLAACGSAEAPADVKPVGAVDGRDTFIFLYTDN